MVDGSHKHSGAERFSYLPTHNDGLEGCANRETIIVWLLRSSGKWFVISNVTTLTRSSFFFGDWLETGMVTYQRRIDCTPWTVWNFQWCCVVLGGAGSVYSKRSYPSPSWWNHSSWKYICHCRCGGLTARIAHLCSSPFLILAWKTASLVKSADSVKNKNSKICSKHKD